MQKIAHDVCDVGIQLRGKFIGFQHIADGSGNYVDYWVVGLYTGKTGPLGDNMTHWHIMHFHGNHLLSGEIVAQNGGKGNVGKGRTVWI